MHHISEEKALKGPVDTGRHGRQHVQSAVPKEQAPLLDLRLPAVQWVEDLFLEIPKG